MKKQICTIILIASIPVAAYGNSLPFVKIHEVTGPSFAFPGYTIHISSEALQNEKLMLEESFQKIGIGDMADGLAVHLILADIDLPVEHAQYREQVY